MAEHETLSEFVRQRGEGCLDLICHRPLDPVLKWSLTVLLILVFVFLIGGLFRDV